MNPFQFARAVTERLGMDDPMSAPGIGHSRSSNSSERDEAVAAARRVLAGVLPVAPDDVVIIARQLLRALALPET